MEWRNFKWRNIVQERYELMQALPREIEVEVEPKTDPEAENKEALLLAEIRSEEER